MLIGDSIPSNENGEAYMSTGFAPVGMFLPTKFTAGRYVNYSKMMKHLHTTFLLMKKASRVFVAMAILCH